MRSPIVERPQAPSDYGFSADPVGMLDWERVAQAMAGASVYWIATIRPDGSPHVHPIWGGFIGDRLYIEGGDTTRWGRNLLADQRVAFGVDSGGLHISGRGGVAKAAAGADFAALADGYTAKYDYRPETDDFWRIEPSVIIALDMSSLEAFAHSPTRFRFEETS